MKTTAGTILAQKVQTGPLSATSRHAPSTPQGTRLRLRADAPHPTRNRYGAPVETVPEGHPLRGESLRINGDESVSDNPNRYKQHGFYFNVDNCIGCHACEAACAEKNGTPPHLAFRSVGYVEGGSYPAYQRLNISMACNHCDNPVCLKGCPTRAYTKFAEYGAVLQDPDICFGCDYCTWVCPYNAPQLDSGAGHVSKCNMCVDRLEEGLKPACATACLGGALDFGVIESLPERREQLETRIPGFPTPDITHPNIRFQQTRSLPRDMTRTDSWPLRYRRDGQGDAGAHATRLDPKHGQRREWNLKKLSTRENPLVVFTLVTPLVVGAFTLLFVGPKAGLPVPAPATQPVLWALTLFGLQTLALVLSTLHLGRPHRFYRAFNNLRHSPVSREVAGVAVFYNLLGLHALTTGLPQLWGALPAGLVAGVAKVSGWGAVIAGLVAIWLMQRIYRIPARPFWNHWQVLTSFYGSVLALGACCVGLLLALATGTPDAAHYLQTTRFGRSYQLRNAGIAVSLMLALSVAVVPSVGEAGAAIWLSLAVLTTLTALLGRALFPDRSRTSPPQQEWLCRGSRRGGLGREPTCPRD